MLGRFGIAWKLVLALVSLAAISLGAMGVLTFSDAKSRLVREGTLRLAEARDSQIAEFDEFEEQVIASIEFHAASPTLISAVRGFGAATSDMRDFSNLRQSLNGAAIADDARDYLRIFERYDQYFRNVAEHSRFADVLLYDARGRVIYAMQDRSLLGAQAVQGHPMHGIVAQVLADGSDHPVMSDFVKTPESGLIAPIAYRLVQNGVVTGALVIHLSEFELARIVSHTVGTSVGVEAYLIDSTGHVLASSMDVKHSDIAGGDPRLTATTGSKDHAQVEGETSVMAAFGPVRLMGTNWGIVSEQGLADLVGPAASLGAATLTRGLVFLAIMGMACLLIAMSFTRHLNRLACRLAAVQGGDYDSPIPEAKRGDEIGEIGKSVDDLRGSLQDSAVAAQENRVKSAAIEATSAALMMTDSDFSITYMNPAVIELMRNRTDDFRTVLPTFKADNLVGVSMDVFHKLPDRIRDLLRNPANLPFRTDIPVGKAFVQLEVNAITDDSGGFQGLVVEWIDVTDLRRNEAILDAIETGQVKAEFTLDGALVRGNENFRTSCHDTAGGAFALSTDVSDWAGNGEDGRSVCTRVSGCEAVHGQFQVRNGDRNSILAGGFYPIRDRNGKPAAIVFIGSDVTEAERSLAQAEVARKELEQAQKRVVDALSVGLKAISSGDLTARLNDNFTAEYEQLRRDFNASLENLTEAMRAVATETVSMRQETTEIVKAADEMARRTEKQAMTLQETAASLDELTSNVASTAEGAARANRVVTEARASAENSGTVVDKAETAMAEIAHSSKEVVKVISVIDDIAFQTNLLALNAGVEAARAGEAGRGFAVVATEVRALAQRCSNAAAEINTLISASGQHVTHGVELVGQTGDALKKIVGSIKEISDYIGEIAQAGDEQSKGLAQINGAVNQIDHVTQQNAAMFEETTSASHGLAQRAGSLAQTIAHFSFGSDIEGLTGDAGVTQMLSVREQRNREAVPGQRYDMAVGAPDIGDSKQDDWKEF